MVKLHGAESTPAGESLRKQTRLFHEISQLNEEGFTTGELLEQATGMICSNWINAGDSAVRVSHDDQEYSCGSPDEFHDYISAESALSDGSKLDLKIYYGEKQDFTENEKNLCMVVTDILSAKLNRCIAQGKLEEEQQRLDKAYKLAHIGTWEYDIIDDKLSWSGVTKEVHGFGPDYEPDVESTIMLFKEGYHRDTFAQAAKDAIERGIPFDVELKIISGQGDERWIRATGEPEYEDGECVRFYGISQNVTGRRKAEEDLEYSERRFKALVKHSQDLLTIMDESGDVTFSGRASEKVLGFGQNFFLGKNVFEFIHPDDLSRVKQQYYSLKPGHSVNVKPFRFPNINREWCWLESTITNLLEDPAVQGYVINSRDVTDRVQKQEELLDSLKEKDTILAEIHHRIKNNLTALTNILQLQVAEEDNERVLKRLLDSIARIHTMASIHEHLYMQNHYSSIDFSDRLVLLAKDIRKTMQSDTEVELNFQLLPVEVPVEFASNCFLVLNEVLTNIFKHAFKGRTKGEIEISLEKLTADDRYLLQICDNGTGFDKKKQSSGPEGTCFKLSFTPHTVIPV